MFAVAGELAVDADQAVVVVDVGPGEAERFADAQAAVGEELEQRPVGAGVIEKAGEFVAFEDRDVLGPPARFLGGFELGDGVVGEPAASDREAADLVERDQHDPRGGRREYTLVRLRPGGDAIHRQLAQLAPDGPLAPATPVAPTVPAVPAGPLGPLAPAQCRTDAWEQIGPSLRRPDHRRGWGGQGLR